VFLFLKRNTEIFVLNPAKSKKTLLLLLLKVKILFITDIIIEFVYNVRHYKGYIKKDR